MNKRITVALISGLLFLTACGQSEAAKTADDKIASITEITIDSKSVLDDLDSSVSSLSEEEKGTLKNLEQLSAYHAQYDQLVAQEALKKEVSELEAVINSIGTVTLTTSSRIENARKTYDAASDEVKNAISNYSTLTAAEEEYNKLKEEEVATKANTVIEAIKEIGSVENISLEDTQVIYNAREAYDKLFGDAKGLVTNKDDLVAAEEKLLSLQKDCVNSLKVNADEYDKTETYFCSTWPEYINTRTIILPYFVKDGSSYYMCGVYNYCGKDWIFWETISIITDNSTYNVSANYFDIQRDTALGANLYEAYDTVLTDKDIKMFRDIAYSENPKAKFVGKYSYEFEIPEKDLLSMRDLIAAYDYFTHQ